MISIDEKLQRNRDFWAGSYQKRPLCVMRLGKHFFSQEFDATKELLTKGHVVTPDQIHVDHYLADYERMYQDLEQVDHDGIFSADPCTGFPWIEGSFGAEVRGSVVSFVTHKTMEDAEELENLQFDPNNPWTRKYLEFVDKLVDFSNGRFPVGEPIFRGVTDTTGSLIGQMELIYAVMEEPEMMKKVFNTIVEGQRYIIAEQHKRVPQFHGGHSFGFYHVWAPGSVMWYQEDLCALLSPSQYDQLLYDTSCRYVEGYDYSLVHLHPTSFFTLDRILKVKNLKAVQINKDVGGPTVRQMVPQILQVIESGKRVLIGMGKLDRDDIDAVFDCLPPHSVALNMFADNVNEANEIMAYVNQRSRER